MNQAKPLNGIHLKIIACAAMCIDHACRALIPGTSVSVILTGTVGRIAFPIFAYLLLEGFLHTRSRKKYALNLLIIALISEIPFDLALHHKWIYWGRQNTCFTLLLGLLFFICLEKFEKENKSLLIIITTVGFAAAFWFAKVDYGIAACVVFLLIYILRYQTPWFAALIASSVLLVGFRTPGAYLCVIPLYLYNRKRGSVPVAVKYLFYAFYPAHLLILALLR